jgi:hypothetical protein
MGVRAFSARWPPSRVGHLGGKGPARHFKTQTKAKHGGIGFRFPITTCPCTVRKTEAISVSAPTCKFMLDNELRVHGRQGMRRRQRKRRHRAALSRPGTGGWAIGRVFKPRPLPRP